MTWIDKLKKRYNLESNLDLILVFILFAITGTSAVRIGDPLLELLGIHGGYEWFTKEWWSFIALRIPVIFILYQFLFVLYGYIIGLFRKPVWDFSWWFEKKMLSRFGIKFKESEK